MKNQKEKPAHNMFTHIQIIVESTWYYLSPKTKLRRHTVSLAQ